MTPSQTENENESVTSETQEPEMQEPETQEPEETEPSVEQVLDTYYYKATLNLPATEASDGSLESKYVVEESTQRGSSDCGIAMIRLPLN